MSYLKKDGMPKKHDKKIGTHQGPSVEKKFG